MISKLASWLPEPGYTIAAGFCIALAILAGFGTSWVNALLWSAAAIAVAGLGSWRKQRKTKTQEGSGES